MITTAVTLIEALREVASSHPERETLICGTGSAPCPPELARRVQERLGCAIHIGYVMTETGGGISATSLENSPDRQSETVGRAMSGMEVRVVDEKRHPLHAGQIGELACRSESRMLSYYCAPVLTQGQWMRTGGTTRATWPRWTSKGSCAS